jgi:hypothetical protein
MSEQDEARISDLEVRIADLRPRMQAERERIVNSTTNALRSFWPDFVSECVRASGEELSELPREDVARVKAEVAAVTEDPASAAREAFERPDWPHERDTDRLVTEEGGSSFTGSLRAYEWLPDKTVSRVGPRRDGPSALEDAAKQAAGAAAVPIASANLDTPRAGSIHGKPLAAWDFSWSDEMLSAANAYGDLVVELQDLVGKLRQAMKSRVQNDAQDAWDSA